MQNRSQLQGNLARRDDRPEIVIEEREPSAEPLAPGVRAAVLLGIGLLLAVWGVFVLQGSARLVSWLFDVAS